MVIAVQSQIHINKPRVYSCKRVQNRNVSFGINPTNKAKTAFKWLANTGEWGSYSFAALWALVGTVSKAYGTDCRIIQEIINIANKVPPPFHVNENLIINSPFLLSGAEVVKGLGWRFFGNKSRSYFAKKGTKVIDIN